MLGSDTVTMSWETPFRGTAWLPASLPPVLHCWLRGATHVHRRVLHIGLEPIAQRNQIQAFRQLVAIQT